MRPDEWDEEAARAVRARVTAAADQAIADATTKETVAATAQATAGIAALWNHLRSQGQPPRMIVAFIMSIVVAMIYEPENLPSDD